MNYKKENDVSYALGAFVVFEALNSKPNFIRKIYTHKEMKNSEEIAKIYKLAKKHNVQITEGSKLIERISGKENVYIMAEFNKYYNKIEAGNQIVLHNPSDMGNVGTILRTALGFGIKNVVFIKPCVDVFNPKVIRASMGALFSLNVVIYENFEDYLCENRDIIKYFFMLDGKNTLQKINFTNKDKALIFGNEASGLPKDFKSYGQTVFIQHSNKIDSLNLSIAVGIAVYQMTKQGV